MRRSPLVLLLITACATMGCGFDNPWKVSRRWIEWDAYGSPAYVVQRIDVRPPKRYRVAEYRWRHGAGPTLPLTMGREPFPPIPVSVDQMRDGAPSPTTTTPEAGVAGSSPLAPEPQPLFPTDASVDSPSPDDAAVRGRPGQGRSSWLFDPSTVRR